MDTCFEAAATRLLIVPGLGDSPPGHWQTWLQHLHRDSVRVVQRDWSAPDLDEWAKRIGASLGGARPGRWIAVAHSFGVLALARYLSATPDSPLEAGLLVAPADPARFGIGDALPQGALPIPTTMMLSTSDPWLAPDAGRRWARRWRSEVVDLGDVGHINIDAGFGTLPVAQRWVLATGRRLLGHPRSRPQGLVPQPSLGA